MPISKEENCSFCQVQPERTIHAGELFVSLLSNPRLRKGHALVVPTRHIEEPMELQIGEVQAIYGEVQRLQRQIIGALALGCDTWQKYQPFTPQGRVKMNHVHFHVIPRSPGDRLFMTPEENQWDVFTPLSPDEREEVLPLLRKDRK